MSPIDVPELPPRAALRRRVLAGETTFGAFAMIGAPGAAEMVARTGFDWVLVDLEHGFGTEADLLGLLHAVQTTRAAAIVRVQSSERLRIGRALDLGADGLMIPRLDRPADVREAVSWMRYPPDGIRGVANAVRGGGYGEIAHAAQSSINERVLGVFQVESLEAAEASDELAAIDGVDVLFVGPSDLSHSMGMPGRTSEPEFRQALRRVVDGSRAAGKAPGILLWAADTIGQALDDGFTFVGIGSDGRWLQAGARAALQVARTAAS